MKKTIRILAALLAMVLILTVSAVAIDFEPSVEVKEIPALSVKDAEGNDLEIGVTGLSVVSYKDKEALPDEAKKILEDAHKELVDAATLNELVAGTDVENPSVYALADVEAFNDVAAVLEQGPITITFGIAGIKADDVVVVLHKSDIRGWEKLPCVVGEETVTVTVTDLSPFAFIVQGEAEVAPGGPDSPKTGVEDNSGIAVIALVITAAAAAVVLKKTCIDR